MAELARVRRRTSVSEPVLVLQAKQRGKIEELVERRKLYVAVLFTDTAACWAAVFSLLSVHLRPILIDIPEMMSPSQRIRAHSLTIP